MRVGINGFFWGREDTGSGQYLKWLMQGLLAQDENTEYYLVRPSLHPRNLLLENATKLWFEQVSFPKATRKVNVAHVPYFAPPFFFPVPLVVTVHDLIPFTLPVYGQSLRRRIYNLLIAQALKRVQAVIAVSHHCKSDIVRILNFPQEKIRVIYEAAGEGCRPATPGEIKRVKEKYRLPEKYLLYLGGFDRRKNLGLLFQALARLRHSRLLIVLGGPLPRRETLIYPDPRRLAREAGIEHQVRFIDWVPEEDKPALYSGATLFLYPSLYEGFGLPPLEAMACGTPVIVSNSSSLPEVVGEGGILLDPQDIEAWAVAIQRLIANEDERRELAARAQNQAHRFSWQKAAEETRAVYEAIAR